MINDFLIAWHKNKSKLRKAFAKRHPRDYNQIVEMLFRIVINPELEDKYDTDNITVLDQDQPNGIEIFILCNQKWPLMVDDYIYTHNFYGSCDICDILESIKNINRRRKVRPDEDQLDEYMTLAFHLLQRTKKFK
jgi:hypothetical protein